jgi:hypothetical protein
MPEHSTVAVLDAVADEVLAQSGFSEMLVVCFEGREADMCARPIRRDRGWPMGDRGGELHLIALSPPLAPPASALPLQRRLADKYRNVQGRYPPTR